MKNYDFNKMVKFLIEEPTEQDDSKRQFKYPFISCELLTCNVGIISEQFFEREPLIIDDEESEGGEHEMPIEEDHSETAGEQTNGIQIKESLSDTSEEDNEEQSIQPVGRQSMTGEQLNKIGQEEMDIEKEGDDEPSQQEQAKESSNEIHQDQLIGEEQKEQQQVNEDHEENKNEMDISQEMNVSTENIQTGNKVVEEQITQKAEEIFSEAILQVQKEKQEHEQIRIELESKYEKIPQDNMYLLGLLLSFFDSKREVNITLAGYVARVYLHLLGLAKNKNKEPEVIEYLYKNENNLLNITNHMHSRSCQDILVKSLCFTNQLQKGKFLATKLKIIDRLIDLISNQQNDLEVFSNSVIALTDLINVYTNYTDGKQIIEYIISEPILTKIFSNLTSTSSKVVYHNASVVCTLISLFNIVEARRNDDEDSSFKEYDIVFNDALQLFSSYIKLTIDYLKNTIPDESYNTAYRQQLQPLGLARLKIIEIYCVALKLDNFYIIQEMAQHNLYTVLLELFVAYEWNNMLHTLIERIIIQSAQVNSHAMRKSVFTDAKLVNFLLATTRQTDSSITEGAAKQISFRKGYLGHVTKIANFIQRLCENNQEIQEYIDTDIWMELKESFLDQTNKNNNRDLGDHVMIDHDSSHSQLHCSYDIEDIKQKSEDFLFGVPSYHNEKENEFLNEVNHDNYEADKHESDDMFFSNVANSIHEDSEKLDENKKEQTLGFDFQDQFFQSYPMTTSTEKPKFEGFFDINHYLLNTRQPTQQDVVKETSASIDDIFKSFDFTTSPQQTPAPQPVDQNLTQNLEQQHQEQQHQEQQHQEQQHQEQQQQQQQENNEAMSFFQL